MLVPHTINNAPRCMHVKIQNNDISWYPASWTPDPGYISIYDQQNLYWNCNYMVPLCPALQIHFLAESRICPVWTSTCGPLEVSTMSGAHALPQRKETTDQVLLCHCD